MVTATYRTKLGKGGVIPLPEEIRKRLNLRVGDKVEVRVTTLIQTGAEENSLSAVVWTNEDNRPDEGVLL